MLTHDGYTEKDLRVDLDEKAEFASEVTFNNILEINSEEKQWGSVLKMKVIEDGKKKEHQYSIVKDWVQYPLKDPTGFLKVDWEPFIDFIKSRQTVKE